MTNININWGSGRPSLNIDSTGVFWGSGTPFINIVNTGGTPTGWSNMVNGISPSKILNISTSNINKVNEV